MSTMSTMSPMYKFAGYIVRNSVGDVIMYTVNKPMLIEQLEKRGTNMDNPELDIQAIYTLQ